MKDYWVRFGCFIIGHDYKLLRNCSEASKRSVKKYLSAILIISIFWGLLGYIFFSHYLKTEKVGSIIAGLVMMIIVIQIEKQIILAPGKNKWGRRFRVLIAIVMAIIGSVITDQIIFKDDVAKSRINKISKEVNDALPLKTQEINKEIESLEILIAKKESERIAMKNDIDLNPFLRINESQTINHPVRQTKSNGIIIDTIITKKNTSSSEVPNPNIQSLPRIENDINQLRSQINSKQNSLLSIRENLNKKFSSSRGLSEELTTLFEILFSNPITFFVWFCFLLFFLAIELFVLMSKIGDSENDYDKLINYQMEIRIKMLEKLNLD